MNLFPGTGLAIVQCRPRKSEADPKFALRSGSEFIAGYYSIRGLGQPNNHESLDAAIFLELAVIFYAQ